MKWRALACLMMLAGCGFQPLHSRAYRDQQAIDMAAIQITVNHSRDGQLLEAEIKDAINPDYEHHEKLYELKMTIKSVETRLFINPDGTSSRADIPLTSTYTLTRIRDGKMLDAGTITRISSYDTSSADYSSYVAMQDARKRGIEEMGQSYKLRIADMLAKLQANPPAPPTAEPKPALPTP